MRVGLTIGYAQNQRRVIANLGGISALGGLACLLDWLGIKPKDLAVTTPFLHIFSLLGSLALFAVSIGFSVWAGVFQHREMKRLRNTSSDAERQREKEKYEDAKLSLERRAQLGDAESNAQEYKEQIRRLEIQNRAEFSRAHECYEQCKAEKEELAEKLEMFTPLQIDALALSNKLLQFIEGQGQPPQPKYTREQLDRMSSADAERLIRTDDKDYDFACEFHYGGLEPRKQGEWTALQFATQMLARGRLLDPWYGKITAS